MKIPLLSGVFVLFAIFILMAGCTESSVKQPTVTVSNIALSDVTLQTMTVNTTVNIFNPNPVSARLNKVAFDVYYRDDTEHYLGHGEQTGIDVKENGNTTVTIPVKIGNVQALQVVGSLVQKGSITIRVNGSTSIDLKVISYELPFEQSRKFMISDFKGLIPVSSLNVTEKLEQARGILDALSG